jgi:nucleoid-associated protein YgaU
MSLFGFVKDIGRQLFKKDEDAANAIKQHIEASNPGVTGLAVNFDHGIVNLSGECGSAEAFQKCVLMAGNVKGVADVYTSGLTVKANAPDIVAAAPVAAPAAAAPAQQVVPQAKIEVEYYLIKSGDTLSKIAKQFYGNANLYPKLFDANKEVIEHPDKIFPGQKIRIPRD